MIAILLALGGLLAVGWFLLRIGAEADAERLALTDSHAEIQ